jgi:hypothetical protein
VWTINCANRKFPTHCPSPNFRLLRYFPTNKEADVFVRIAMNDARVDSEVIKAPANIPFLIPYSLETAMDPEHVNTKLARFLRRHEAMVAYRAKELQTRVQNKSAGETGLSNYARQKDHVNRDQGAGAGAGADADADADANEGRLPERKPLPEHEEKKMQQAVARASAEALEAAQKGLVAVPEPVMSLAELPERWRASAPASAGAKGDVKDEDVAVICRDFPEEFLSRSQSFAIITVMYDDDSVSDSPKHADAAGREPMIVVFGGAHKTVDDAKAFVEEYLSQWCTDINLDIVEVGEWLWPTEVDPDRIDTKYRTHSAQGSAELQTIMDRRKSELRNAQVAQDKLGASLPVTRPNQLPTVADAATAYRAPVRIVGVDQRATPQGRTPLDGPEGVFARSEAADSAAGEEEPSAEEMARILAEREATEKHLHDL